MPPDLTNVAPAVPASASDSADCVPGSFLPPSIAYWDSTAEGAAAGLALFAATTPLDPRETSPGPVPSDSGGPQEASPSPVSDEDFRHSFWSDLRPRLRSALAAASAGTARLAAWDACGSCAWVLAHRDDPNAARLVCHRCHDRWCEACATEKRRRVARNLQSALTDRFKLKDPHRKVDRLRFLTLTLKAIDAPLADQVGRLRSCWGRLRNRSFFRKGFAGGIAFFELTLNNRTGLWHPHLHVLFEGTYIPHAKIKEAWFDITGDSYIVDVRAVRTVAAAVSYVAKYAAKAVSHSVLADRGKLVEAIGALKGTRTYATYGNWIKLGLTDQPAPDEGWYAVCSLQDLLRRANSGCPESRALLAKLRSPSHVEPLDNDPHPAVSAPVPGVLPGPAP